MYRLSLIFAAVGLMVVNVVEPVAAMPRWSPPLQTSSVEVQEEEILDKNALEQAVAAELKIEGVVIARKKYSFTVLQNGTTYEVKLADNAPIALSMTKPWFDWSNDQVVVDAKSISDAVDAKVEKSSNAKRVAVRLPSTELHLISRFATIGSLNEFLGAKIKRVNFYLITPNKVEEHFPSEQEPFLAGKLRQSNDQLQLSVDGKNVPVKLGFRLATMNGFSINELTPNETYVVLAGHAAGSANEIIASRVLFQPMATAASTGD